MGLFGKKGGEMAKRFDKSLDKATDPTLLEPNWDAILDCVDQIRAGEVAAKHAVTGIRKKLLSENPHSILNALLVLDACVKNCGSKVHTEIATKEFMTEYRDLVQHKSEMVRDKSLEMLQCWAMAFRSQPAYKIIVDTHNLLELSGFAFPSLKDPETMYIAQVAPEWVDGDNCFRCRTEFGLLTRKHHCRACGQIFCGSCSSKEMELPLLGIEKSVRVCDSCYEKGPNAGRNTSPKDDLKKKLNTEAAAAKERELKEREEEELQLALAMSQSEADAKERERKMYSIYNGEATNGGMRADDNSSIAPSESIGYRGTAPSMADNELGVANDDPLAKYLNRDYWEKKTEDNTIKKIEEWKISAPVVTVPALSESGSRKDSMPSFTLPPTPTVMGDDQAAAETIQFCDQVKEQVTMMDSRIRSNIARGRSIINDSAILPLFEKLTNWHGEVLARMAKLDEDRAHLESLQDHLAHIGEARQAMDALREEHGRRMREEEEERRRQKQAAMSYKLEMMRVKKHEMLMNQRHAALERFQQNEMMHRMGGYGGMGGVSPQQGMPPQGMQQYGQYQPPPTSQSHPAMYQPQPQTYTGDQNGQTVAPSMQIQQGMTQMQGMTNGQHHGMAYGMQSMAHAPLPSHPSHPMEHQSIHPSHQQYHMVQSQQDSSMVPSVNGVSDQSMAPPPPPSHIQYVVPQPDHCVHSTSSTHLQYVPTPAPPSVSQHDDQSNLLISFD